MFVDTSKATVLSSESSVGAALDIKELNTTEAMMIGAGVVGAGVLGTSLIISTMAAPLPVIGGTSLAIGLAAAATIIGDEDDLLGLDDSAPVEIVTDPVEPPAPSVTKFDGSSQDIAGL